MFTKGQEIQLELTDLADGDRCFGRLPDGLAVFVRGPAAVGDAVTARVTRIKKNFLEASLVSVARPASTRVKPACAHFGVCGGCKWQHVDYAEQLRIKRKMVADALERIGGFKGLEVMEPLGAPRIFGYRNKVDYSFGDRRYLLEAERAGEPAKPVDFALGFHAPGRFDKVLDIDLCHIATPEMNIALDVTKRFSLEEKLSVYSTKTHEGFLRNLVVRQGFFTGELMVHLVTSWHEGPLMDRLGARLREALGPRLTTFVNGTTTRKNNVAFSERQVAVAGPGTITERLDDLVFTISPNSFFQTNSEQALALYRLALAQADLRPDDVVYDLYTGTGTIAQFMSRRCRRVVGIEQDEGAVADARANAERNGAAYCEFIAADLKHFAAVVEERGLPAPDVVVTDPPRAGMHPKAVDQLLRLKPRRIVYVSCNPASLARDAALLCAGGAYGWEQIQPVDLFPHTYHVETAACLARRDDA